MDPPRRTPQSAGPPPLPLKPDERERPATFLAVAVAFGTLLLLLLTIWLARSSRSATSTVQNGAGSSGSAGVETIDAAADINQDAEGAQGVRKPEAYNSVGDLRNLTGNKSAVDTQRASPRTPPEAPESTSSRSANQREELVAKNEVEVDVHQPAAGNLFFTLGEAKRNRRTEQSDAFKSPPTRDAFTGRSDGGKERLLRAYGGTAVTEAAVKLGLEWLAKNQQENGLWSLKGPYGGAGTMESTAAATAMALLAFQGAGHTHRGNRNEPFTRVVERGSKALLKYVSGEEIAANAGDRFGGYAQALCTIAICELYGMTGDRKLRAPALQALEYCIGAQSPQGGWRYIPKSDSDTSVTGWFLMGLQSARMAGLDVPDPVLDRVSMYLDAAGNLDGSRYSYQPGSAPTQSMTAEALLCRQYLGWRRDEPPLQDGVQYLLGHMPGWNSSERDVYYWYYATQVCHHIGGDQWRTWNGVTRELLPAKQVKEGPERGSWNPIGDRWGGQGGRLYVTCMCLYILEVYYRYLPLYQEIGTTSGES